MRGESLRLVNFDAATQSTEATADRKILTDLLTNLDKEYTKEDLSPAQRLKVLEEVRKTIQLRALITGIIEPAGGTEH